MNADTEKLIDQILEDQVQVRDLNLEQMETLIDYMREQVSTIDNDEYREALLVLVDAIEMAAETRFVADAAGDWADTIEASMARGNTYFELENPVVQ